MPKPAAPTNHPTILPVGTAAAPVTCKTLDAELVPFEGVLEVVVVRLERIGSGGEEDETSDEEAGSGGT